MNRLFISIWKRVFTKITMPDIYPPLLVAIFVSASAGLLGAFAILKKMALVGDALTHVALPGMALGLLFNFSPFLGALAFLVFAIFGIWLMERYSKLSTETLVGIFFSASLALGVLITPDHELVEALFGNIISLTWAEAIISAVMALILILIILILRRQLALNMVSSELAQSAGINNSRLNLIYLLIFALAVALGIRFVGAVLMGSLVIIPAAAARNIASSFNMFLGLSMLAGVLSAVISIFVWQNNGAAPGPIFILVSVGVFLVTLVIRGLKR